MSAEAGGLREVLGSTLHTLETALDDPAAARRILAGVLALCALGALGDSWADAFWFDEVVTEGVSSIPTIGALSAALAEGVDSQTLGYYLAIRPFHSLPIDPHLGLRLPSNLGFLLAVGSAYFAISHRCRPSAALLASGLVALSGLRDAAAEARPYPLLVGFVALAAALWMRVDRSWKYAAALGVAVAGAAAVHHMGVLLVACLGLAELVHLATTGRARPRAWAAISTGVAPFALGLPNLLRFRADYAGHFWSRASLSQIAETWTDLGTVSGATLVFVAVLAGIAVALAPSAPPQRPAPALEPAEGALIAILVLYPVWLVLPAWLSGSVYVARYGMPVVIGLGTGAAVVVQALLGPRRTAVVCAATLCTLLFHEIGAAARLATTHRASPYDWLPELLRAPDLDLPVAVGSSVDHLPLWRYAPARTAHRYVQLADPELAAHYIQRDTVDRAEATLARFADVPVREPRAFVAAHPRFYAFVTNDQFTWLPPFLLDEGYTLTLLYRDGWGRTYLAERPVR